MTTRRHTQRHQRSRKAFSTLLDIREERAASAEEQRYKRTDTNPMTPRIAEWQAAGFGVREIYNETDALVAGLTSPAVRSRRR